MSDVLGNKMLMTEKTEFRQRLTLYALLVIVLAAWFFRLEYNGQTTIIQPIRADARQYVIYGYNLKNHGTFSQDFPSDRPVPDSLRSPGFPMLVAVAFWLGGERGFYSLTRWFQVTLGGLLVVVAFWLGRQMLPTWGAFGVAALVALSPHLVAMSSYLLTETLFGFCLLLAILAWSMAVCKRRVLLFFLSGIAFGYAYLVNETVLPVPFILTGLMIGTFRDKSVLRTLAVFLAAFVAFPIAWLARNAGLPEDAPKGSRRAVANLSHGAYPGFIYQDPKFKYYPYLEDPQQPAFGSSLRDFAAILYKRFRAQPLRYVTWYLIEKPYYLWSWDNLQSQFGEKKTKGQGDVYVYQVEQSLYDISPTAEFSRKAMKMLHPVLLVLAVAGIPFAIRRYLQRTRERMPPDLPIFLYAINIYYTLLHMIFASWPRYSVPLRPELYLCALWSAVLFGSFLGRRRSQQKAVP